MSEETMDLFAAKDSRLTVCSWGAGQESSVILEKYLDDPAFRRQYAPNDFLVLMSDTGDEFPETYKHVERTKDKCQKAGVEFVFITKDMGFHSRTWPSLREFYRQKGAIGSRAFNKVCTQQLKLGPIYRYLEFYLAEKYGVQHGKKRGIREFAFRFGKIKMLIGFAKGEERRVADPQKNPNRWFRDSIEPVYPLLDLGMDRAACQQYLHDKGMRVVPSNCMSCHFCSLEELEYLRRFHPRSLADWVELEAAKLAKYRDRENMIVTDAEGEPVRTKSGAIKRTNKNYGVFGVKPLPVKIEEARVAFHDWTDDRIADYRYSHGHCVSTSY